MRRLLFLLWISSLPCFAQTLEKGVKLNGSLSIGAAYYTGNGINARRPPFNWYLSGAPTLTLFGISMPFSLVVSDQDRRFSQPFNQYGVSPRYKWATIHAGYRNVRFGEFTLNGANMLGGGFEINPGKLRLGAMYGRLNRAVNADSIDSYGSLGYIRATYKRMGYAAKVGFGTSNRFIDLSVFGARDDSASIAPTSLVNPEQNLATGLKSHLGFFQNRLQIDLDAGISFLTRNTNLNQLLDSANNPLLRQAGKYIKVNASSGFFTAWQGQVNYSTRWGNLRTEYKKIDPGYRTLGAYYFQNDVEQITLSPSFQVLKGRLGFNLSYGAGRDNLNNKRISTTVRQVYSANLNIVASNQLNINLDYSNFGVSQNKGYGDLFNDTTAIQVINNNLGGVISFRPESQHQLTISTFVQNTNDLNRFTESFSESNSLLGSLSYSINNTAQKWNANAAISYNNTRTDTREILLISPTISASKVLDKWRFSLTENFQLRSSDGSKEGHTSSTNLSVAYRLKKHSILWGASYMSNKYSSESIGTADFSEFRSNLSYTLSF
jgi:hypothetical protein